MNRYYYKKEKRVHTKTVLRILSLAVLSLGLLLSLYIFFPLISWQIYFAPVFASYEVETPIPKSTVLNPSGIKSLVLSAANSLRGVDYTDAQNWFPNFDANALEKDAPKISSYTLSIPKLKIHHAFVSTVSLDLSKHLVSYPGTALAPMKGNAVVFGHSTLPQLFKNNDYKTIFANLHTLKIGDEIVAYVDDVSYTYKIYSIVVVDPSDTSVFAQNYDDSYLTLITCTPPGTVWKRLIIKTRLERI